MSRARVPSLCRISSMEKTEGGPAFREHTLEEWHSLGRWNVPAHRWVVGLPLELREERAGQRMPSTGGAGAGPPPSLSQNQVIQVSGVSVGTGVGGS